MHRLIALVTILTMVVSPGAAAAQQASPPAPPDAQTRTANTDDLFPNGIGSVNCQGVNLVVATQTGPQISGPVQQYAPQWAAKTGANVEVQTFAFGDLFEKIRTGFVSGANPFDVIIYAPDWAGDIMGAGYVSEVPQGVQDEIGYGYLIPTFRDRLLSWGGTTYGLPYDGDNHMIYFRRDWLSDPQNQADFKAKYSYDLPLPPKTWRQYHDIAEFFQGKTVAGQTVYGAGEAFKRKAQSYWTFLGRAAAYAKAPDDPAYFFDADTMQPRINNPGFVQALQDYKAVSKLGPPDVLNWDVGDIRAAFPSGKLALAIDWADIGTIAPDPNKSVIEGKWGSAMEPGAEHYWDSRKGQWVEQYNQAPYLAFGGWIQSVAKTTKNPDCAFDLAAFMGNPNMSLLLNISPETGVNPHFYSDVNDITPWLKVGMSEQEAREYLDAIRNTESHPNVVVDLRITGAAEYFDALDTQLARAIVDEVTPQQALDEVANEWNSITDRLGRDQQKTLYRQMLNLPTS